MNTPILLPSETRQILGVSEYDGAKEMVKKFGAKRAYEIASFGVYWKWKNIAYIIMLEHGKKIN